MKWILVIFTAARAIAACQTVEGDRITGKDLMATSPVFSSLDPTATIASAPVPGVQRIFHPTEMAAIARAHEIPVTDRLEEVCFELATESLTADKLLPILVAALNIADAKIEILDFSRHGVPHGGLYFTRAGLSPGGLWRGRLAYGVNRTMQVWVKVRITTLQTWIEADQPIPAGHLIDRAHLNVRTEARFPLSPAPLVSMDQAAGRMAARSIRSGEPIFTSMLLEPREVQRGDRVAVEVWSGQARLTFDGTAESSGRTGELILVQNPENGRSFQARVEGRDKVSVKK